MFNAAIWAWREYPDRWDSPSLGKSYRPVGILGIIMSKALNGNFKRWGRKGTPRFEAGTPTMRTTALGFRKIKAVAELARLTQAEGLRPVEIADL
jgi:hypothetical protein